MLIECCSFVGFPAALQIMYQELPQAMRQQHIDNVMRQVNHGHLDLSGLLVAREETSRIIGVLLTQLLTGQTAAIWAPIVSSEASESDVASALVKHAMSELLAKGVCTFQAVLDEPTSYQVDRHLVGAGMQRITELLYFKRDTRTPLHHQGERALPLVDWVTVNETNKAIFIKLLENTYRESLDLPELDKSSYLKALAMDCNTDIGKNHEAWRFATIRGQPDRGVVLTLTDILNSDSWQVSYLGVVPTHRRTGLGWLAISHALDLSRPKARWLKLAVDSRNEPAICLYKAAGFQVFDRRIVYLKILPENSVLLGK